MISLNEIREKFEKKKIEFYEVQLSVDTVKSGIKFQNIESFSEFVYKQKIDVIFGCQYYDDAYDYIITKDMVEKNIIRYLEFDITDIITKDIEQHNQDILKIDFDSPSAIIVAGFFKGQFCYVYIENETFDEDILVEPNKKLQEIVDKNANHIENRKKENQVIVEKLKSELKEKIVDDDKFWLCTNKHLRYVYIKDMVKNKLGDNFEPLKECWESDAPVGVYTDATDFVEMIWKEGKNK